MGCIPLSENQPKTPQVAPWRNTRHEIIFEADTKAGKTFDIVLIVSIFLSIIAAMPARSISPNGASPYYSPSSTYCA